jgi:hypothetical protein
MPERNLVIIHRGPDYVRDFREISDRITAIDPEISVFAIDARTSRVMPDDAWARPTLTVALLAKFAAQIRRGPILANRAIHKTGQYHIFQAGRVANAANCALRTGDEARSDHVRRICVDQADLS